MPQIRPLSASLQRTAIEELNEVPERLDADIAALRTWIEQQPHMRARRDDQFLVAFLRGCKFSLEKAKSKLDRYYTLRTQFPDFYTIRDVDSERIHELLRLGVGLRLPRPLHDDGPRLIYVRPGCYAPDSFSFEEIMSVSHALSALSLQFDDYAIVHGWLMILDFSGYTPAHLMQMTPSTLQKMSVFAEDAMPVRDKGRHMINTNAAFEVGFNMMRSILPAKQQGRISVHGSNLESLYSHIPQRYLPTHLGGEQGTIEELKQLMWATFQEQREYLRAEADYGVDDKLRPAGQRYDYNSIFGVDGSFRRLNFD
ncbi:alpha-tocopherol transfer protein-like [Drosophila novamexicana]|uniref:alpha-tocopherol transfer protein-like n=1 Tax=Drosophila novamexicana TaxID=47314 RepID=UPI0011E602A0|nr:alpha-tocopherol transfer protein-like [Drosophila novamexicana]